MNQYINYSLAKPIKSLYKVYSIFILANIGWNSKISLYKKQICN